MLHKIGAAYLIIISVAVALYIIVNPLHAESYNPENVWLYLDILMVIGAALALAFNGLRKCRLANPGVQSQAPGRHYWEVNIAFYATLAVSILLMHNWFSLLALGLEVNDHQGFIKWAAVDTALPLVFGATGLAMLRKD